MPSCLHSRHCQGNDGNGCKVRAKIVKIKKIKNFFPLSLILTVRFFIQAFAPGTGQREPRDKKKAKDESGT